MRATALLVAVLIAFSGVSAQLNNSNESTPVTLFFHLDGFQNFPINTQAPEDFALDSTGSATTDPTSTCLPDAAPNQVKGDVHTYYGYSTPGYVEYDELEKNGTIRTHDERGLAGDVILDKAGGGTLYWYLVGDFGERGLDAVDVPAFVPQVKVAATIRTGDDVGLGDTAYNSGVLIGEGMSEPQDILPSLDGAEQVIYEFQVPITFAEDIIPKEEAFNIRVDIMMDLPECNEVGNAFMPGLVDVYTAQNYRPRFDLNIMNPVFVEYVHPQISGERLIIHTGLGSPWGNYDVDETPGGIEVKINGPSDAITIQRAAVVQRTHEHNHHFEPVDVTYVWPFVKEGATLAEYDIEVTVWNDQRSGSSSGSAKIDLESRTGLDANGNEIGEEKLDEANESPIGLLMPLLGLIGVAMLRRR